MSRYTLSTNALLRTNLFNKFGPLNRYTSLGADGFQELTHQFWASPDSFHFSDLNPVKDFNRRGVEDKNLLPGYYYRDDSLKLWDIIQSAVKNLMSLFYLTPEDVMNDSELQVWDTVYTSIVTIIVRRIDVLQDIELKVHLPLYVSNSSLQ